MRAKLWAWALLAAAPVVVWLAQVKGQAPVEVIFSNQRQLRIPVNVQENRRGEFKEFLLFASWDQGRNWQQVAAIPPDRDAFTFTAPNDGLYWLRSASVNRQNQQIPENLYVGPPDLKVVIDTLKPLLKIKSLDRQGDDVLLAWEMQEENPDWNSFRVEYQEKGANALVWTSVSATAGLTGQTRFRPTTTAPINVRVQMRDQAGNQSFAQGELAGTTSVAAKPAPMEFPNLSNRPDNLIPVSVNPTQNPSPKDPPPLNLGNPAKDNHPKTVAPPSLPGQEPWSANPPVAPSPSIEDLKPVATTDTTQKIPPASDPIKNVLAQTAKKPLPPLQIVNNPEVTVEYELNRVGPSGVGSVELWWTQDNGQSWELYAYDDKSVGVTVSGRHQRTVELPGDGVYGFILIVKSRAGLGKAAPRPGDVPEMRVEVDTVPPVAQLWTPTPDTGRPNAMLFRWTAKDTNLGSNPITLEWAEKREGPWQPIAANLPNTGKYSWQLPDKAPVQAYIRIRIRDQAGNESVATTPDPQQLDLSEPEGRLLNVTATPRR